MIHVKHDFGITKPTRAWAQALQSRVSQSIVSLSTTVLTVGLFRFSRDLGTLRFWISLIVSCIICQPNFKWISVTSCSFHQPANSLTIRFVVLIVLLIDTNILLHLTISGCLQFCIHFRSIDIFIYYVYFTFAKNRQYKHSN